MTCMTLTKLLAPHGCIRFQQRTQMYHTHSQAKCESSIPTVSRNVQRLDIAGVQRYVDAAERERAPGPEAKAKKMAGGGKRYRSHDPPRLLHAFDDAAMGRGLPLT